MYPAYTRTAALEEYALVFFNMLAEGYRLVNEHYEMLALTSNLALMEPEERRQFLNSLRLAQLSASDILKPSDDYSGIDKVAKMM